MIVLIIPGVEQNQLVKVRMMCIYLYMYLNYRRSGYFHSTLFSLHVLLAVVVLQTNFTVFIFTVVQFLWIEAPENQVVLQTLAGSSGTETLILALIKLPRGKFNNFL